MNFRKLRLVRIFKLFSFFSIIIVSIILFGTKDRRNHLRSYFSTRCLDYRQKDFSRKLNDRIIDYSDQAKRKGIKPFKDDKELKDRIVMGRLVKVKSGKKYLVDKLTHSYPYITKESRILLEDIAERLREKTSKKGLKGVRMIVTSMTRKTESVRSLRRNNKNASANSPHLYGNAFDITYNRFRVRKWVLTNCDDKYLKEALAEVIWQLRLEKRCWATYETGQNCFHVVCR